MTSVLSSTLNPPISCVYIDGCTLEGGGQLVRTSVALSALTNKPILIDHIRGTRRGDGGLKAQHLACVMYLAAACNAELDGAELKSQRLVFRPGDKSDVPATYSMADDAPDGPVFNSRIDIGTLGSITLTLQSTLPFILFRAPNVHCRDGERPIIRLTITGGTNVSNSPSVDYVEQVLLPTLSLFGLPAVTMSLKHRGWGTGPVSIGSVTFCIPTLRRGEKLAPLILQPTLGTKQYDLKTVNATVFAPASTEELYRQSIHDVLEKSLSKHFPNFLQKIEMTFQDTQMRSRNYLLLVATVSQNGKEHKLGYDGYLGRSVSQSVQADIAALVARIVAPLAADLKAGALFDEYMVDQLIIYQALAAGNNDIQSGHSDKRLEPRKQSLHADTMDWLTGVMLGSNIRCGQGQGAGFVAA